MSPPTPTVYLITGASQGIGHGLLTTLLHRPHTTILAALLEIDASSPTAASTAIAHLQSTSPTPITHIDTVIANAGHYDDATYRIDNVPLDVVQQHLDVNTLGVIRLFQATYPLLQKSQRPMFLTVGSFLGSIAGLDMDKAAANWVTRKMHVENQGWVCFVVHPGFVKTGMGNACAKSIGIDEAFTEVGECVDAMIKLIDGATRETFGGRFVNCKGEDVPF
ncbi:NAD(P)-binding protein [Aspergillus heteromorphus CBS 117.55]|uniref:NAD(P)-binding protein n=1 Tax=Aspergillus heteromorphus CBS 117.55 TaxID=1448321 RepID=A0A317VVG8_9EURO|nr:NAD(P)-binding protein [Aspergillus heteromorphus CBS 117.55]PWY78293.1 NAD(P)-binding protein [Aspergillus heteromorphus CBS 117.55]